MNKHPKMFKNISYLFSHLNRSFNRGYSLVFLGDLNLLESELLSEGVDSRLLIISRLIQLSNSSSDPFYNKLSVGIKNIIDSINQLSTRSNAQSDFRKR